MAARLRSATRSVPVLAVATVVVLASVAALAMGATGGGGKTIRACVSKRSGVVRVIGKKAHCHRGERRLSWNTQGLRGPRGRTGASGQTGPRGPAGSNATVTGVAAGGALTGTYPNPGLAQPTFTDATLQNGWAYGGSTGYQPGYAKDALGFVHLRGTINGASSTGDTAFTLPAGMRPAHEITVTVPVRSAGILAVVVDPDGTVRPYNPAADLFVHNGTSWFLDGVTFHADG